VSWAQKKKGFVEVRKLEAMYTNSARVIVPVLALHVVKHRVETATANAEFLVPEMQQYFVTPEDARSGSAANRLTFTEAINRMIF
jgi:hypothetical protein